MDAAALAIRLLAVWVRDSRVALDRQRRSMLQVGARVGRAQEAGREMALAMIDAHERLSPPGARATAVPPQRETHRPV